MRPREDANAPLICFETLGCAKNEVDTRDMTERLRDAGARITAAIDRCDVASINTCSFIQSATEESIEAVLDALEGREGGRRVIVCGCMPARYGDDLAGSLPEADGFVPCSREDDIVQVVSSVTGWMPHPDGTHVEVPGASFAYLKISDGCDRWCSFCTIPQIRGRYHSFASADILAEARRLAESGTREIVLIGQDTGIWGTDIDEGHDLAWLVRHLTEELPSVRFRIMYTEPEGVTDGLLDAIADAPNACAYLDIPLQHVSPHILKAMRRTGSADRFRSLVEHVRKRIPDITLRTTLMCGFPGETEEDFEELVAFVQEGLFQYVGVFAYSPEEGTRAASLPDQVPEDVREARARELRDEADSVSAALISARVGQSACVVVDGVEEDGQAYGRAECQAPEVDGVTYVDAGSPGDVLSVKIEDTLLYDMEGTVS